MNAETLPKETKPCLTGDNAQNVTRIKNDRGRRTGFAATRCRRWWSRTKGKTNGQPIHALGAWYLFKLSGAKSLFPWKTIVKGKSMLRIPTIGDKHTEVSAQIYPTACVTKAKTPHTALTRTCSTAARLTYPELDRQLQGPSAVLVKDT